MRSSSKILKVEILWYYRGMPITDYRHHCCMYAAGAHFVTGHPIYFLGGGHAVLKTPLGWFDENGINPIEDIAAYWGIGTDLDEAGEYSEKNMVRDYRVIESWDEIISHVRAQAVRLGI